MNRQVPAGQNGSTSSPKFILALSVTVASSMLSSILVLAFKSKSLASYRASTANGLVIPIFRVGPEEKNNDLTLALYPLHLVHGTAGPMLAGAGISLGLASSVGVLTLFVCHRTKALLVSVFLQTQYIMF